MCDTSRVVEYDNYRVSACGTLVHARLAPDRPLRYILIHTSKRELPMFTRGCIVTYLITRNDSLSIAAVLLVSHLFML